MEKKLFWSQHEREDLKHIEYMKNQGWTVHFFDSDKTHQRTTPDNPPMHTVSFSKYSVNLWKAGSGTARNWFTFWVRAELLDGHYKNQTRYKTLFGAMEAREKEKLSN